MNDTYRSQFRLPAELADKLRSAAEQNNCSMNAEIVSRLERSFVNRPENDLHSSMLTAEVDRLSDELRRVRGEASPALARLGSLVEEQVRQVMGAFDLSFEDALLLAVTRGAAMTTKVPVVILQVASGTSLDDARALIGALAESGPAGASVFYEQTDVRKTKLLAN